MMRPPKSVVAVAFIVVALATGNAGGYPADADRVDADSLHRRALERLADSTFESRRLAIEDLDRASRQAPGRSAIWFDLARACAATGQLARSRTCLERFAGLEADDPQAQLALGQSWKWDWLASLERSSLDRAVECLMRAAKLAPRDLEPRLALTAIALVGGDTDLATRAARSALLCDSGSPEALLAWGCASYRTGSLTGADSAFQAAIPRLAPDVRRRFAEPSNGAGTGSPGQDPSGTQTLWASNDPDLTTAENEVELNFLARVAQALLLFREREGVHWDMRAELFARYGIPSRIDLHPPDSEPQLAYRRLASVKYAPPPIEYPYNVQIWTYPDLGMGVELWDRGLNQTYDLPVKLERDPDPRPDPNLLAKRPDLMAVAGGRAVYRTLAPGVVPMTARAELSRFPAENGGRLLAHLETAGGPADSLWGSWAVIGADGRAVARAETPLSISACDPAERRVAQFAADLPPGEYRIDVAVSDRRSRRGVVHLATRVPPPSGPLALSDLVLLCGQPSAGGGTVRIEPDLDRTVRRARTLSVYFELDGLAVGADGGSRFAYTYALRRIDRNGRPSEPVFEASREEEHTGGRRRQFVSVPLESTRRGSYDLAIAVRDLVAGTKVGGSVRFVRE